MENIDGLKKIGAHLEETGRLDLALIIHQVITDLNGWSDSGEEIDFTSDSEYDPDDDRPEPPVKEPPLKVKRDKKGFLSLR